MESTFTFDRSRRRTLRLLCLGAHSDDIEIGCGGTILKLLRQHSVSVTWVVLSGDAMRAREARASAALFLRQASSASVRLFDYRVSFFPADMTQIKETFETLKAVNPDVIFTHTREDLHQDHRVVCQLTWNTFRHHPIFEYEIPKYDGDTGSPNAFCELSRSVMDRKVRYLMKCFATQRNKHWFSPDLFTGLARLRGIQCAARDGFAEAFYARKLSVF
jgi:LmbE family N-acetylglucosaminyl deacetylase